MTTDDAGDLLTAAQIVAMTGRKRHVVARWAAAWLPAPERRMGVRYWRRADVLRCEERERGAALLPAGPVGVAVTDDDGEI